MKCCSETMFRDSTPPSLCLLSAANDPQTGIDPQIGPQMIPTRKMIPEEDPKRSRWKTRNGMEFVPRVVISTFNIKRSKL